MKSILQRLEWEKGTIYRHAKYRVGLLKPSPYFLSMSSLGFQQVYKIFNACEDFSAQRAFLPDDLDSSRSIVCYETQTPLSNVDILAISIAYELEIPDLIRCFQRIGLDPLAAKRGVNDPLVLIGGPLSFSNMMTLRDLADVMILGEAEESIPKFCALYRSYPHKLMFLEAAAERLPELWVPTVQEKMPAYSFVSGQDLPAYSQIVTPDTEFSEMFLIESERGCHRRCTFCVMRREGTPGMRLVSADRICELVPPEIKKVGLVGAAVSDHPELLEIVKRLCDAGHRVSLSSLRTDRITPELLDILADSGLRTLTIAADGPTQALRQSLTKDVSEAQLIAAGQMARERRLGVKLYVMLGLPGETDEDMDELADFILDNYKGLRLSLGLSPFISKRHTPLDNLPFAGIRVVERRLKRLQKRLSRHVDLRQVSAKWAFIEYVLSQGGPEMGHIAIEAVAAGGRFSDWKRALLRAGKEVY